jgi:predicted alpha-1,2-mannosidase
VLPAILALLSCHHSASVETISTAASGHARFVNTFVGTANANVSDPVTNGGGGSTFPGAAAPFGMVQWSPDTPHAAPPGYFYPDSTITGFGMNHLNGAGCPALRDFPVLPVTGSYPTDGSASVGFSHSDEIASPGFYQVTLANNVKVDLTATQRSGLARFTFPATAEATVLVLTGWYWDIISETSVDLKVAGPHTLTGSRTDMFCGARGQTTVYYYAEFDRDFVSAQTWGDGQPSHTEATAFPGGVAVTFDARSNPIVHMKVGLSFVSLAGAQANLAAEDPGWDFNAVHQATMMQWNKYLDRVAVTGGTETQEENLYTALYHVFLQPEVFSDSNGDYMGFDKIIHHDTRPHYANYSGWDIYRSWIQLVSLLAPTEASDIIQSLIAEGQQGTGYPRWAFGDDDTGTMIGDPSDLIVANGYAFGARNIDTQAALQLMLHGANDVTAACNGLSERPDNVDYLPLHYMPADGQQDSGGSAADSLELAMADFAIAQFADAQGESTTAAEFMTRGRYWQNLFDPAWTSHGFTGWILPRSAHDVNGAPSFVEIDASSGAEFREGNAFQYLFLTPQDVPGLIQLVGGDDAFIARLDALFQQLNAGTEEPYFYMGNEPGFETPWEYTYAGAAWKTQQVVNQLVTTVFTPTPDGLPGNEDLGAMSSWLVWGMLGMYPEVPGVGGFVLASPSFPKTVLTLENGKTFTLLGDNASPSTFYVQSATLNGAPQTSSWLPVSAVTAGGTLELNLGSMPGTWASAPADRPPAIYQ